MIEAVGPYNTGAAAGGAGVSTANSTGDETITGRVLGYYIRYNDSPPATTDVTVTATGGVMPERALFVKSDYATDGYIAAELAVQDAAGAAVTNSHAPAPLVRDKIKVTIAQANVGDSVDVWVVVDRD